MPAFEMNILTDSVPTTVNHSLNQYKAVKDDGTIAVVGEVATGVSQNKPNGTVDGGATLAVMRLGISRMVAGAAIARGVKVSQDAAGLARTAVTGDHVLGISTEAAAGVNAIFPIALAMGGAPLA